MSCIHQDCLTPHTTTLSTCITSHRITSVHITSRHNIAQHSIAQRSLGKQVPLLSVSPNASSVQSRQAPPSNLYKPPMPCSPPSARSPTPPLPSTSRHVSGPADVSTRRYRPPHTLLHRTPTYVPKPLPPTHKNKKKTACIPPSAFSKTHACKVLDIHIYIYTHTYIHTHTRNAPTTPSLPRLLSRLPRYPHIYIYIYI